MRFNQSLAAAFGAAALAATTLGLSAGTAQAAITTVPLPITQYAHMLVDPVHKHLFITSGSGSSSILVTNYAGQTVATIPNEPGADGLALSTDGSTVYAALTSGNAVSAISTSSLTETARYSTGAGTDPTYVTYTSGKIWFGYGAAAQGGIGSIDPSTSPPTVTLNAVNAPINTWYAAPIVTSSASGELVAGEPGQSPVQLATYDVSSGSAVVLAPVEFLYDAANLGSMQITPDGTDVVTASGAPYYHQIYAVSNLAPAGIYPTTNYPNSVSISADGFVAAGTFAGSNEIFMFAPGGSTPVNTFNFGSNWPATDGAALLPDGSELFVVTLAGGPTGAPLLNIIPDPEVPTLDPTTTAVTCSPAAVLVDQPTSCTATVTDTAASGATTPTGTVTFASDTSGGSFSSGGSCALSPTSTSAQASCSLSYTPGQGSSGAQTITADYGGDSTHAGGSGQASVTVYAFPSSGGFVIGDNNSGDGAVVTFWGSKWATDNSLSGGSAPSSFKGFENSTAAPRCGATWTTGPGNSSSPPAGPLPAYMGVIVSSTITKSGSTISGDIQHIVIVATNPGYAPNPGHAGTGTVVAQVC
jgi:hypothetical protein